MLSEYEIPIQVISVPPLLQAGHKLPHHQPSEALSFYTHLLSKNKQQTPLFHSLKIV